MLQLWQAFAVRCVPHFARFADLAAGRNVLAPKQKLGEFLIVGDVEKGDGETSAYKKREFVVVQPISDANE